MAGHVPGGAYRQATPSPAEASGLPPIAICGACGVGAPARGTTCEACEAILAEVRRQVPATPPLVWCAVRATFQCRSCAFHSPLDGVEVGQGVHCAQCGAFQKFDASGWEPTLTFAHGVADLAGPTPEGMFPSARIWIGDDNPHRDLGISTTFAKTGGGEGDGGGALPEAEVARGFPVCAACRQPLEVSVAGGTCETRCRGCAASARYQLPSTLGRWAPAVRAVVSSEQRVDQRRCRLQQQAGGGVIALLCPQCGAPLRDVRAGSVRCNHCHTSSFVPARARPREDGGLVEADPFFVAFDGPSRERGALEAPTFPAEPADAGLKVKGLFARGLQPLAGIELPERKRGLDLRQLVVSLGLTGLALAVGFALVAVYNHVLAGLF